MWPFRTKSVLPAWQFKVVDEKASSHKLGDGSWFVTDGCRITELTAIAIGRYAHSEVKLIQESNGAGLSWIELRSEPTQKSAKRADAEIVIDSGLLVICCQEMLQTAGITNETDQALLNMISKKCPGNGVLAVTNEQQLCVAIAVSPLFGDGAYRIAFEVGAVRIDVGKSA